VNTLEIGSIRNLIPKADSKELSLDVYRETGFFVLRSVIPESQIREWQHEWDRFYTESLANRRDVDPFNPVAVHEQIPEVLSQIHKCPQLLDVMQLVYPDLALFMQRFVIKDERSRDPVFVHQDFCYDFGWPDKTTVFIPLSACNQDNGGISCYPGTHHFGYLGDAGETNTKILGDDWPLVCPSLEPGDLCLMHTCTWHCSPPHVHGPDRILVQATFQPASDPSGVALLRGQWKTKFRLNGNVPRESFFVRSRASRLRELQTQLSQLKHLETSGAGELSKSGS
jgi:hypothetical protein